MIDLNTTQLALLLEMQKNNEPQSSQYFANSLGLSSKTVRTYLSSLNYDLGAYGASIRSKSGLGFWLEINDPEKFAVLKNYLNKFVNAEAFGNIKMLRAHVMIRELLASPDYIKTEFFMDLMFINSTSIKQALDQAKLFLSKFYLSIISKSRHGIKISGSEHDIRNVIYYEYMFYERCGIALSQDERFARYVTDQKTIRDLQEIILSFQSTYSDLNLSQWAVSTIARSIYVWKIRNEMGNVLDYDDDTISHFTNRNCYYVARLVLNESGKYLGVHFNDSDVIYLTMLLVAWRTNLDINDLFPHNRIRSKDIALDVIQHLHELNHFSYLNKDLQMIDTFSLYVESYLIRSRYNLYTNRFDSLMSEDVSLMARKLAFQALVYLHKNYGGIVTSEEICYLSNLIRPYFGHFPHQRRPIVCAVVSRFDKLVGNLIKERLLRNFNGYFERIDVLELYELQKLDTEQYSIIFTSYDQDRLAFVGSKTDIVYTTTFFDEDYKMNLHKILMLKCSIQDESFANFLPEKNVLQDVNAKNQDEVILELGKFLFPDDEVKFTDFIDELTLMENADESIVKNNTVCLTGLKNHLKEKTVVMMILKKSIAWGESGAKAQVVVYWDGGNNPKDSHYFENEFIPHEIDEVFHNKMVIDEILTNFNYQNLIMYFDEYRWLITMSGRAFK